MTQDHSAFAPSSIACSDMVAMKVPSVISNRMKEKDLILAGTFGLALIVTSVCVRFVHCVLLVKSEQGQYWRHEPRNLTQSSRCGCLGLTFSLEKYFSSVRCFCWEFVMGQALWLVVIFDSPEMHFFLKLVTVLIFLTPFGGDLVFEHFFFSLCFDMCRFLFLREKSLAGLAVIYFLFLLCSEVSDGSVDELRQARDLFYRLYLFCVCFPLTRPCAHQLES